MQFFQPNSEYGAGVPGPETQGLRKTFPGTVIYNAAGGGLHMVSVATGRQVKLLPDNSNVFAASGPDRRGRIALIEQESGYDGKHSLTAVSLPGMERARLFAREGDASWTDSIGRSIAMSPSGRVAVITPMRKRQMQNPSALLTVGDIEIWSLGTSMPARFKLDALDGDLGNLAWFPDGRRLLYVSLKPDPRDDAGRKAPYADTHWPELPTICVLDTRTGESRMLSLGEYPAVSNDGQRIFVPAEKGSARILDPAGRSLGQARLPGLEGKVLAVHGDRALYWAEQTAKRARGFHPFTSPEPTSTLKVADISDPEKFETVLDGISWPSQATYGAFTVNR